MFIQDIVEIGFLKIKNKIKKIKKNKKNKKKKK
jgi:hypothetical protein